MSDDGGSSNGRTADSDSANPGSNPGPPANKYAFEERFNGCVINERSLIDIRAICRATRTHGMSLCIFKNDVRFSRLLNEHRLKG